MAKRLVWQRELEKGRAIDRAKETGAVDANAFLSYTDEDLKALSKRNPKFRAIIKKRGQA